MSLIDRPSPNPTILRPNYKQWGQRYSDVQRQAHKEALYDNIARYRAEAAQAQAVAAGHPSVAPVLYDRTADSDRPEMPTLIACALDRLLDHVRTPGKYTRVQVVEAADVVRDHFRPDLIGSDRADACNPHGMVRP